MRALGLWKNRRELEGAVLLGTIFTVLVIGNIGKYCEGTKISFENGAYENILIALNENTGKELCADLVSNISETFTLASKYLEEASGGRARFGKLRILIPREWNCSSTVRPGKAGKDDIYEAADIKIADHPIAMKLPWTEQIQGCGKSGETIYSPPSFFTDEIFSAEERSRIFLHEWFKFRYGVFEEYGFLNDIHYPPCYTSNGSVHYTSCTSPRLSPLEKAGSNLDCGTLLDGHKERLLEQLKNVSSSILFAPHITLDKSTSLCTNDTHNGAAMTKQNYLCYRKSSVEIVFSHSDFQSSSLEGLPDKKYNKKKVEPLNTPELIWHTITERQAYAFVIEDTFESRTKNKRRHVKQSVAEFLHFVNESPGLSNMAFLLSFGVPGENVNGTLTDLVQPETKKNFLRQIRDTVNEPVTNGRLKMSVGTKLEETSSTLYQVFRQLNDSLQDYNSLKWNVILIGDSDPGNLSSTLEFIKETDFTISVITFDSSKEWLRFNDIQQTRKVIHLPVCDDGTPCSTIASSLMSDHFLEILSSQQPRRYFQKLIDVNLRGNETRQFTPENISGTSHKNFLLSFPRYSEATDVTITSPRGENCLLENLYDYPYSILASSCTFQNGNWTIALNGVPTEKLNAAHVLRGYVEVFEASSSIVATSSIASDSGNEVIPSSQNMMVPLHVVVKTADDHPVIEADVTAEISFGNQSGVFTTEVSLTDDGIDPDVTKNDGVYSGFIFGYSIYPSFHSGFIKVKGSIATKSVSDIQQNINKAHLLDVRMDSKCCGYTVPLGNLSPIGEIHYSHVLPSFRTGEVISNPHITPPSRIVLVEEIEQTQEYLLVQFVAPVVRGGTVDHYDLCLISDDSKCNAISKTDCSPVPGGQPQDCKIYKADLLTALVNPADLENKTEVIIVCGIRGVNSANVSGPISFSPFEILLLTENYNKTSPLRECKYISEGCLPIEIFWILIGLMSGLVLILVMVISCWFCMARKDRSNKEETETKLNYKLSRASSGRDFRSKAPSNAGFSDDFATRDLYTASIRRPPSPDEVPDNSFLSNNIRRRSISSVDIPTRFQTENQNTKLQSSAEVNASLDEMPVFFNNGAVKYPSSSKSSFKSPDKNAYFSSQPEGTYNFQNQFRAPPTRQFQQNPTYPVYGDRNPNAYLGVPSVSSMVDTKRSDERLNYREPVYASVNRNGRRSGTHLGTDRNSGMSLPLNGNSNNNRHAPVFTPYSNPMMSARPQSLQSLDSGFARSQSPIRSPQIRMDRFPSSESETYSEMSRGGGNPPPPPPPMPTSLNEIPSLPRRHATVITDNSANEPSRNDVQSHRGFTSRTPPKENGFSILAKMGPIPDRKSVLKPRTGPPQPPPRINSLKKTSYRNTDNPNSFNGRNSIDFEQNDSNLDDENDSDTWDAYDEFEFNPGVSHV